MGGTTRLTVDLPDHVADRLAWIGAAPGGATWLRRLPHEVAAAAERWQLDVGEPFSSGLTSLVIPATRPDGTEVVLKLPFPDRESHHEARALREWAGHGAVLLVDHHDDALAPSLLLERCQPGTPLSSLPPDRALDELTALLPRLWVPAGPPFGSLAEEAEHWVDGMAMRWTELGGPFPRALLDEAVDLLLDLGPTQGEQVLVNQDLHGDNVLAAAREPWLVVDPKPLSGEREFGVAPIVRSPELGHGRDAVMGRLDRLCDDLDLDRDRARGWALAQTVAWSFGPDGAFDHHVEVATWLSDAS